MKLSEVFSLLDDPPEPRRPRHSSQPDYALCRDYQPGVSLLDRPAMVQNGWIPPKDRGQPSAQEQFKINHLRPLPDNVTETLDIVADRLATPGL
jgi:hypothetical protein